MSKPQLYFDVRLEFMETGLEVRYRRIAAHGRWYAMAKALLSARMERHIRATNPRMISITCNQVPSSESLPEDTPEKSS